MKLTVLGGGGARIPALVRAVVGERKTKFDQIDLFEPSPARRASLGRLSVELAGALGFPDTVRLVDDVAEALTGTDYVFSAVRVGGDDARIVDEQVALRRGIVGHETQGPGGCAMALRTIPVVLAYCDVVAQVAPGATLVNFTNPAGIITQAITRHGKVRAVGVCDTPSQTFTRVVDFLGADPGQVSFSYAGLNHLGWISSVVVDGEERIDELVAHYGDLKAFNHRFAFEPDLVRRLGAIPTEYLYYYYDSAAYLAGVSRAGTSRGQDVKRFNESMVARVAQAFSDGDVHDAWATYSSVLSARRASNMLIDFAGQRADIEGASGGPLAPAQSATHSLGATARLAGTRASPLRSSTVSRGRHRPVSSSTRATARRSASWGRRRRGGASPCRRLLGIAPLANTGLEGASRGLVLQVKEYERAVVEAAIAGDAELAALALALHPLVPGITAAREMMAAYREAHRPYLDYLR